MAKLEDISRERIKTRLRVTTEQLELMQQVKKDAKQSKGKIDDRVYNAMMVGYDGEIANLKKTKWAYERTLKEFSH